MVYFIGNTNYEEFKSSTLQEMYDYCISKEEIGIDIETTFGFKKGEYSEKGYKMGLDPYMSNIVMIQIGDLKKQFIIDCRDFDNKLLQKYINPILLKEDIVKVGHNLQFEGMFFLHHLKCRIVNVWDTMICEKVLYNGERIGYSLQALMYRYLGIKPLKNYSLFEEVVDSRKVEKIAKQLRNQSFLVGKGMSEDEAYALAEDKIMRENFVDKSTRLEFLKIGGSPFTIKQIEYGKDDIVYPLQIRKVQLKGRQLPEGLYLPLKGFRLENKVTQVLAESTYRGVNFNGKRWIEAYDNALILYIKRKKKLDDYVVNNHIDFTGTIDLFTSEASCAVQWSSSKQVIKLFKKLKIAKKEKSKSTGRMEWTVGAKTMFKELTLENKQRFYSGKDLKIVDSQTLILQYLLFKKSEQLCTTFGKDWLRYIHPITGRVHPRYNQYMITSRLSCTSPNLQQIPGTKDYRRCFVGNLINSDFASQELRIAAEVHGVQKMIDFFAIGDPTFGSDFHSFSATQLFRTAYNDPDLIVSKKTHPEERDKSKSLTFLLNYGGSSYSLSGQLGISEEEAEKLMVAYFKGLPGMEQSFKTKQKEAIKKGWIQLDSYTKKKYFFPDIKRMQELIQEAYSYTNYKQREKIPEEEKERLRVETPWKSIWKEYMSLKGKLERRALNLPIQGCAATMAKLAAILLYNYRWENNLQDKFIVPLYVHDEVLVEVLDDKEKEYAKVVEEKMIQSGTFLLKKVPMGADAVISDIWEH